MAKKKIQRSKEFEEKAELIRLQAEAEQTRHDFKMVELGAKATNAKRFHEMALERGRIESVGKIMR